MVQVCTVYVTKIVSVLNVSMASLGDDCGVIVFCAGAEGINLPIVHICKTWLAQHFLI